MRQPPISPRTDTLFPCTRLSGSTLAFLKSDFALIGPFAGITVAEDMDWGRRARAAGMKLSYNPQMLVYHPARKSVAELESKWSRHIAHELEKSRGGKAHVLKWTARSIAEIGRASCRARVCQYV